MNEAALEVAAGINSTVTQVTSALRLLVSTAADVILDAEGQVSQQSVYQVRDAAYTSLMNLVWWLGFTPLQGHVLKALIIILVVNFILITVSWHVYAQRISHTLSFNSLRIVEDILKKNTNFKIPKEHSSRL